MHPNCQQAPVVIAASSKSFRRDLNRGMKHSFMTSQARGSEFCRQAAVNSLALSRMPGAFPRRPLPCYCVSEVHPLRIKLESGQRTPR